MDIKDIDILCEKYSKIYPVLRPAEIKAIIKNESNFNEKAVNPNDPSWGLMQVTEYIGKKFAGIRDYTELYDPDTNVKAGAGFLAYLKEEYSARFPLSDPNNGWIQMYNIGEPHFLNKHYRNDIYQANFMKHLEEYTI